jgi:sarcosine oxidase subunit gamma
MPERPTRHLALAHMAARLAAGSSGEQGVVLEEVALESILNLRGAPDDARFRDAVRAVIDAELPLEANTFSRAGALRVLWLGPDEWLIAGGWPDAARRLTAAVAEFHASVTDLGAAYAVLELRGRRACEVLAKACPLDLHPRAFRPGQCAQSILARTQGIVMLEDDAPVFRLFVRRSFAGYLAEWLLDAMEEYRSMQTGGIY